MIGTLCANAKLLGL